MPYRVTDTRFFKLSQRPRRIADMTSAAVGSLIEDLDVPRGCLKFAVAEPAPHPGEIDTLVDEPRRVRATYLVWRVAERGDGPRIPRPRGLRLKAGPLRPYPSRPRRAISTG